MAAEARPRLLYLLTSLNGGGAEWGLVTLIREGAFEGLNLQVACLFRGAGAQLAALETLGHPPRVLAPGRAAGPLGLLLAAWRLRRLLRERSGWDALILSLPHANLLGRLLRPGGLRRPLLLSFEHNSRLSRRAYELGWRLTSRRVDWMLADCQETAEAATERLYRHPPPRTSVLPLVAFSQDRLEGGPAGAPPPGAPARLLYAGRFSATKNVGHLVAVVAALRRKGVAVELTLHGQGPFESALRAQAAPLGEAVRFAGASRDWWRTPADLFVLASRHEGLCIVAAEAMAAGLPLAATAVGALRDYGRAADMVELGGDDAEADGARILERLRDPARLRAMGEAGRREMAGRFAVPAVQAEFLAFRDTLRSALASPDRSRTVRQDASRPR